MQTKVYNSVQVMSCEYPHCVFCMCLCFSATCNCIQTVYIPYIQYSLAHTYPIYSLAYSTYILIGNLRYWCLVTLPTVHSNIESIATIGVYVRIFGHVTYSNSALDCILTTMVEYIYDFNWPSAGSGVPPLCS